MHREDRTTIVSVLIVLAAFLGGCGVLGGTGQATGALLMNTAQATLSGFSVHFLGEAKGELAFNGTFIVVDARVDLSVEARAPLVLGGPPSVIWSRSFARDAGQRAYRVLFSGQEGAQFVQIVPVSWTEARIQMPFLSDTAAAPGALIGGGMSAPVRINRKQ